MIRRSIIAVAAVIAFSAAAATTQAFAADESVPAAGACLSTVMALVSPLGQVAGN